MPFSVCLPMFTHPKGSNCEEDQSFHREAYSRSRRWWQRCWYDLGGKRRDWYSGKRGQAGQSGIRFLYQLVFLPETSHPMAWKALLQEIIGIESIRHPSWPYHICDSSNILDHFLLRRHPSVQRTPNAWLQLHLYKSSSFLSGFRLGCPRSSCHEVPTPVQDPLEGPLPLDQDLPDLALEVYLPRLRDHVGIRHVL